MYCRFAAKIWQGEGVQYTAVRAGMSMVVTAQNRTKTTVFPILHNSRTESLNSCKAMCIAQTSHV